MSGKPSQYDDLEVFVREQDVLRELAAGSSLPVLEIDMSDGDLDRACGEIADWMTATGGLCGAACRLAEDQDSAAIPAIVVMRRGLRARPG